MVVMGTDYNTLSAQIEALAEAENNYISILANASALLMEAMEQVNWAGFYLVQDGVLKVGPFQGKPACVLIMRGRGVCGTSWKEDRTIVVPNVHEFPGHIACDSASRSEIVIPIHHGNMVVAVLDIDSPKVGRFSDEDRQGIEQFVRVIEDVVSW